MSNEENSIIWNEATDAERGAFTGAVSAKFHNMAYGKAGLNVPYLEITDVSSVVESAHAFVDERAKKIEDPRVFIPAFIKGWIKEDVEARPHAGELDLERLHKLSDADRGRYVGLKTAVSAMKVTINQKGYLAIPLPDLEELGDDSPEFEAAYMQAYTRASLAATIGKDDDRDG